MFLKSFIFLFAIASVSLPAALAYSQDIEVRAGDVRVTTERDGTSRVYTRSRWRGYPYNRSRYDWRDYDAYRRSSCSEGTNVVTQETRQISRSGRTSTYSRTSTSTCN